MSTIRTSIHPQLTTNFGSNSEPSVGLYVGLSVAIFFTGVFALLGIIYLWTIRRRQVPALSEGIDVTDGEIIENVHASRPDISSAIHVGDRTRRAELTSDENPDHLSEYREKAYSNTGMAKMTIPVQGGCLQTKNIALRVDEGCLTKETEITMILDERNRLLQPLFESGLLKAVPLVVEFLPRELKFLKSVDLTAHLGKVNFDELFVLCGKYDIERQRIIWNVMVDEAVISKEGSVSMKLNSFDTWTYIVTAPENIARILCHLNKSFNCTAVVLYRRIPTFPMIDVAVVLFSEYVIPSQEQSDSLINKIAIDHKYHVGEKSSFKRINTDRCHEMCTEFLGIEATDSVAFHVDLPRLDSIGMVLDHFQDLPCEFPARGTIHIYEVHGNVKTHVWSLNINEIPEQ